MTLSISQKTKNPLLILMRKNMKIIGNFQFQTMALVLNQNITTKFFEYSSDYIPAKSIPAMGWAWQFAKKCRPTRQPYMGNSITR